MRTIVANSELLESFFPLHEKRVKDRIKNTWLYDWGSSFHSQARIELRNYLGEKFTLYFVFLRMNTF